MAPATYKAEYEIQNNSAFYRHTQGAGESAQVILPLPPTRADEQKFEMEVYARFMRHLRHVPGSRMDIRILAAIQFTADMMDHGDALVAKILVDQGLRAPRRAFPVAFLEFVDKAMHRFTKEMDAPQPAAMALTEHWAFIGEGETMPVATSYEAYDDTVFGRA